MYIIYFIKTAGKYIYKKIYRRLSKVSSRSGEWICEKAMKSLFLRSLDGCRGSRIKL